MKAKSLCRQADPRLCTGYVCEKGHFRRSGSTSSRWEPSVKGHLDTYNRIDIALDTFPYNGTTTTCEALWMGVPVVTLAGDRHASRVGMSLLSNIGLPELIAQTEDEYIDIAVKLAADTERLQLSVRGCREMMRRSPVCDAKGFTTGLELHYRRMWEEWCKTTNH